jgi:hypothetical protein
VRELDGFTAILESHFGYEERRVAKALGNLGPEAWTANARPLLRAGRRLLARECPQSQHQSASPGASYSQLASNLRRYGWLSVVLHHTEFVALGIGHDDDRTLGVVVSFTGEPSSQRGNELDRLLNLVHGDVEMNADLAHLRLGNRLEHQSRLGIAAMAKINPAVLRRPRLATEQGTPKARHALRVNAVERHSRHNVRHERYPTTANVWRRPGRLASGVGRAS